MRAHEPGGVCRVLRPGILLHTDVRYAVFLLEDIQSRCEDHEGYQPGIQDYQRLVEMLQILNVVIILLCDMLIFVFAFLLFLFWLLYFILLSYVKRHRHCVASRQKRRWCWRQDVYKHSWNVIEKLFICFWDGVHGVPELTKGPQTVKYIRRKIFVCFVWELLFLIN